MKWLKLLVPPEWDLWLIRDRITYFVVTALILGLVWLGAQAAGGWAEAETLRLLRQ